MFLNIMYSYFTKNLIIIDGIFMENKNVDIKIISIISYWIQIKSKLIYCLFIGNYISFFS